MATGYKNPPVFDGDNYETWKNEIEIWRLVTDLDKKKQALAVTLSLKGQARAKALEIDAAKLNLDTGMTELISALDSIYKGDKIDIAYSAYSSFDGYRRGDTSIGDYIIEFERRNNRCKRHDMLLPDSVLAFKLLDGAGLDKQQKQLILTAVATDLKYDNVKAALKRILGGESNASTLAQQESGIIIKQESAYFTRGTYGTKFGNRNNRQNSGQPQSPREAQGQKGTNPLDRFGRRSRCAVCGSTFHWAKDCEHRDEERVKMTSDEKSTQRIEECNLAMFTHAPDNSNVVFMTEAYGTAVIDTACTRTVCGRQWLEDYARVLEDKDRLEIVENPTKKTYCFGDGGKVTATRHVTFPAFIGEQKCSIGADVVDIDLPLLLSKESLKRAEAIIDLTKDEAVFFGKTIKLEQTSSGHYCVDLCRSGTEERIPKQQALMVIEAKDESEREKLMRKRVHVCRLKKPKRKRIRERRPLVVLRRE